MRIPIFLLVVLLIRPWVSAVQYVINVGNNELVPLYPAVSYSSQLVNFRFRLARIFPDVLDTIPSAIVNVTYPSSGMAVTLGNFLTPFATKDQPDVGPWVANPLMMYTLIMLDGDGNPASTGEPYHYLKWLRYNIQGSILCSGVDFVSYQGAGPQPNSGVHRYVFLVYTQLGPINPLGAGLPHDSVNDPTRATFHLRSFVLQNQLSGPLAGNFFRAVEDAYSAAQWAANG
ncbi:putative OV-16 antigen [Hypsibius exemplaris]|uniref:OV-16 antigen n=1 Tax=Hypsibius exemplaris TaxID=2072580 RepID=A0A9X6NK68_HYPEX|nr:putative OV-16 antigen [Hypsibius exemplaris]